MSPRPSLPPATFACRLAGHRWHFEAEGNEVVWHCGRGCGEGGRHGYASAADARRHRDAFNRPSHASGRLMALFGGAFIRRDSKGGNR